MASLLEIRKKIGSVKNMKKITKAMQLVATSKMKQFQEKAVSSRHYIHSLLEVLDKTLYSDLDALFTEQRSSGKRVFILYSSDKGLCGNMNLQLFKGLLTSDEWLETAEDQRLLITIGKKASDMARVAGIDRFAEWNYLPERFVMTDLLPLIADMVDLWEGADVQDMYMVVPYYKNAFTFYPQTKKILPFDAEMVEHFGRAEQEHEQDVVLEQEFGGFMFYEPDVDRVKEVLYTQIFTGLFAEGMYQLKATEYSSRMIAMQNATDAAQKMIDQKTLIYNKIRQQMITQQISEIVNAAEAIL